MITIILIDNGINCKNNNGLINFYELLIYEKLKLLEIYNNQINLDKLNLTNLCF